MRHQGFFSRLLTAIATLGLVAAEPAPGQDDDSPRSLFGEVIDVRVVNLEVVVSGRGERVSGLGPRDFVLTVDGREVPIDYFTEVRGGVAVAGDDEAERAMVPALAPGEAVGTSYLLFIDELLSLKPRRDLVLRKLSEQLVHLAPEDRMAVVAYDGRRLEMLSSWTGSLPELARVLEDARRRPAYGMQQRGVERLWLAAAGTAADPVAGPLPGPGASPLPGDRLSAGGGFLGFTQFREFGAASSTGLSLQEEQQVAWLTGRTARVVAAATAALRSFAEPPGRKVMVLMSGGWPDNPTEWLLRDTNRFEITRAKDREVIYGPLIETANRLAYTLYPIDVPGTSDPPSAVSIERATLRRLAAETGGRPMLAGDGLRALEKTVADTRSYYWIGFVPQWKGDDESHRIGVDVRRKGVDVRARRTFSDLSREREVTMRVESSLRLGDLPGAVAMPVEVAGVEKARHGKVMVALQMLIPLSELTFLPHDGQWVADAELRVAVEDSHSTSTDIPVVPVRFTLDSPPEKGQLRRWSTRITIRKEKHDVLVSLYDKASGQMLSARLEVDPNSI